MVVKNEADTDTSHRQYRVIGQVFFASSEQFIGSFDFKEAVSHVDIDLSQAHFWDLTSVAALDKGLSLSSAEKGPMSRLRE